MSKPRARFPSAKMLCQGYTYAEIVDFNGTDSADPQRRLPYYVMTTPDRKVYIYSSILSKGRKTVLIDRAGNSFVCSQALRYFTTFPPIDKSTNRVSPDCTIEKSLKRRRFHCRVMRQQQWPSLLLAMIKTNRRCMMNRACDVEDARIAERLLACCKQTLREVDAQLDQ